jgi:hypothetical protein
VSWMLELGFICIGIWLSLLIKCSKFYARIMEEASKRCEMFASEGLKVSRHLHHNMKSRALAELAPNVNLSCILATGSRESFLQTHYLYEVGGNIGKSECLTS